MTQESDDSPKPNEPGNRMAQAALAFGFAVIALFATSGSTARTADTHDLSRPQELSALDVVASRELLSEEDFYCEDAPPLVDPPPTTEFKEPEPPFPRREHLIMIGRLSSGITKLKSRSAWWECGKKYETKEEIEDAALEWAYRIVYLSWEYSDNGSSDGHIVNPWGVAGVAKNESGFDRCALGMFPRLWAYKEGTLKRSRLHISHTKDEIVAAMTSDKALAQWRKTGIDAAPLHELWWCGKEGCRPKYSPSLPAIGFEELFSLGKGFEYNVRQMKKRAIRHNTDRPWLYWRGYKCEWYDKKITRWARQLGARSDEI